MSARYDAYEDVKACGHDTVNPCDCLPIQQDVRAAIARVIDLDTQRPGHVFGDLLIVQRWLDATEPGERCGHCGELLSLDAGEGYDGLCGSCADVAERNGRWG